jgi:hypothetical protein
MKAEFLFFLQIHINIESRKLYLIDYTQQYIYLNLVSYSGTLIYL